MSANAGGANLILTLNMQQVTDYWVPANGFDNTSFTIFFNLPEVTGSTDLPLINAQMPAQEDWDLAHVAYGWGNYMYRSQQSNARQMGKKVGVSPQIKVDKQKGTIEFTYRGEQFGVQSWQGVSVFITTWDITGEGAYRELSPKGGEWVFAGGKHDDPKILDAVMIKLK